VDVRDLGFDEEGEMTTTTTIHDHPVWEDLRRTAADELRQAMAAALFDDVRPAWEHAVRAPAPRVRDPLTTLAIAYRDGMRVAMAAALFDDAKAGWGQTAA
jgi:hypothetical protein